MHRTKRVPGSALGILLFGLAALVGGTALAQGPEKLGPPSPVIPTIVPRGSTIPVQMSSKKFITAVDDNVPGVVNIQILKKDPGTALVTGLTPGLTRVTFTDVDGRKETFEFTVQTDVEYLKYILRKAVPTATIEPVPSANNSFVLTGYVQRAEDVPIVVDTVRSVVGDRVINALRVGGGQQIEICVTVARVARSEARSMGFSFLETGQNHYVASILSSPLTLTGSNVAGVAGPAASLGGSPNAIFGIVNNKQGFVGFLEALRNQNLVKVLAEPKLITTNGRPAEFISGGEQAVPTLASGGAGGGAVSGVEFRPFGTTVRFLPIILGDGKIYIEVEPQFTFPDPSNLFSAPIPGTNSVVFGRTTQRVRTSIILEDGQTFAIGGMVFRSINGSTSRVPVLGDLPFIGTAFSTINYTESEEELLVLVTPHLIDSLSCRQLPKLLPGQETRSPDDFELFLERILEAPRGPRHVFNGLRYNAAYRNGPTTGMFPCGDGSHCLHGRCDVEGGHPTSACGSLQGGPNCGPNGCGGPGGCTSCGGPGGCNGGGHGPEGAFPGAPLPEGMPVEMGLPLAAPQNGAQGHAPRLLEPGPAATLPPVPQPVVGQPQPAPAASTTPVEGGTR